MAAPAPQRPRNDLRDCLQSSPPSRVEFRTGPGRVETGGEFRPRVAPFNAPAAGKRPPDLVAGRPGHHSRDLAVAVDDPLGAGQLAEPAGASGVVLVGADADLGAEAELAAVVEPGAGVDDHGRGVDLGDEPAGGGEVAGQDRLGVARAVAADVGDRGVERVDDADGQDQVEVLGVPVGGLGRASSRGGSPGSPRRPGARRPRAWRASATSGRKVGAASRWTRRVSAALQTPGALGLGVDDDPDGHREVGVGVDVDVAVARVVLQDRHLRLGDDPADQALAAPGDGQVDPVGHRRAGGRRPRGRSSRRAGRRRAGRPLGASSSARTRWRARFEWIASLPPRRIAALPLLTQSAAASTVTFGRLS